MYSFFPAEDRFYIQYQLLAKLCAVCGHMSANQLIKTCFWILTANSQCSPWLCVECCILQFCHDGNININHYTFRLLCSESN